MTKQKDNLEDIPQLTGFADPTGLKKGEPVTIQEWQDVLFGSRSGKRVLGEILMMCRHFALPMPADPADIGRRAVGTEVMYCLGVFTDENFEEDRIVDCYEAIATGLNENLYKTKGKKC